MKIEISPSQRSLKTCRVIFFLRHFIELWILGLNVGNSRYPDWKNFNLQDHTMFINLRKKFFNSYFEKKKSSKYLSHPLHDVRLYDLFFLPSYVSSNYRQFFIIIGTVMYNSNCSIYSRDEIFTIYRVVTEKLKRFQKKVFCIYKQENGGHSRDVISHT